MGFRDLLVTEIFHSLQGETSLSGLRFAFIRLTGCNLRCSYCDSTYAFKGGRKMSIPEILAEIAPYQVKHVLLTGGEPLLQRQAPDLVQALRDSGYEVSIETHGEVSIQPVAGLARIVMDIKTPSSGMSRGGFKKNLPLLRTGDEIKFVIGSKDDYAFAKEWIQSGALPSGCELLLSPVIAAKSAPGKSIGIEPSWLAEKILEDRLPARMQLQLHKIVWGADRTGV